MTKRKYKVDGMSCAACVARVEKSVKALCGVEHCEVNLLLGTMDVSAEIPEAEVIAAVKKAGYFARAMDAARETSEKENDGAERAVKKKVLRTLVPSAVLLVFLMYLSMGHVMWGFPLPLWLRANPLAIALCQMLICIAIMVINKDFYHNGTKGIVNLSPNMDTLVSLGSAASFIYSVATVFMMTASDSADLHSYLHSLYFESAAMILVLIRVGKLLEAFAKGKTTSAIKALMDLSPKRATVIRDGVEREIDAKDVRVNDIFVVRRGDRIACDGEIAEGQISVDESMMTGESVPRDKAVGDSVLGASVVSSGYAKIRAVKIGEETAFAEVIKMVKEAAGSKAPIAKAADKVAAVFVPAVLLIALVTTVIWSLVNGDFGHALSRGICVLVISCPCALGLATPASVMVGSGVGARNGILFKNAEAIELCGRVNCVAFDKTGTLTEGKPAVDEAFFCSDNGDELIALAAAAEGRNEHPIAAAIKEYAVFLGVDAARNVSEYEAGLGGISASVSGKRVAVGNMTFVTKWLLQTYPDSSIPDKVVLDYERICGEGKTALVICVDGNEFGVIAVADSLRSDAKGAIGELHKMGIETVMITGDNESAARLVANKLGIDRVIVEVLPSQKAEIIRGLADKGRQVAMVGDGINDSVALTEASVGIAIGRGADVAVASAGVVLQRSSVSDVVGAIRLGRKTLINIYENLFWAFCYNLIGIPLAAGVFSALIGWELNPMFGALAMSISSFLVVSNSLRLNLYPPIKSNNKMQTIIDESEKNTMETVTIKIEGMMCPHCSGRVKSALLEHSAVKAADVSHERGDAIIELRDAVAVSELESIITNAGYKVI